MGFNYIHSQTVFTQDQQQNSGIILIWVISVSVLPQVCEWLTHCSINYTVLDQVRPGNECVQCVFLAVHVIKIIFSPDKSISSNLFKTSPSAKSCMIFFFLQTLRCSKVGTETQHFQGRKGWKRLLRRSIKGKEGTLKTEQKMCAACGKSIKSNNQAHDDKSLWNKRT